MPTLFISDLHLARDREDITRQFLDFLEGPAAQAEALYILGDLFDYWMGDDDLTDPFRASVADALGRCSARGVPLFLMHGNRDFLLGPEFCRRAGATLLADPGVIDLHGTSTLLMHGDTLCTMDVKYLEFRRMVRGTAWQETVLAMPLAARRAHFEGLRAQSAAATAGKAEFIMDVSTDEVVRVLAETGCRRLIHGHTHRPARHEHPVEGVTCERWVLADWYARGSYLRCDAAGCTPVRL